MLAFLDDDARLAGPDVLARCVDAFRSNRRLGAIALRIVDENGDNARRHVPRIGSWRPDRDGPVTAFLGGAALFRRDAFEEVGGYAAEFRYAMEETDLALRLVDAGWAIHYDGTLAVVHPGATRRVTRELLHRRCAIACGWPTATCRRRLPSRTSSTGSSSPRSVGPRLAGDLLDGVRDGWRTRPRCQRQPIGWRTVARLTRLGRPPIV